MTTSRPSPYIHVGWLKKLLVGDDSCVWASWFKSHYRDYPKMPSDFILASWKIDHTAMLTALREELVSQGKDVYLEGQNQFWLTGKTGISVSGTPDLIAFEKSDKTRGTIYDTKTGKPNQSDIAQVMIYMWALPYARDDYKSTTFDGVVVYNDHRVPITSSAIANGFEANVVNLIKKVGGDEPALKIPSEKECGFCELTSADCTDKIVKQHPGDVSDRAPAF